ncbi:MAG: sulfotransferase domain-containing protein [Pseudomonadota bacterium]
MTILQSARQAYLRKVRAELWTNFSVLRHRAFDGVLVTSKNSGTHWLKYMLAIALAEENGIPRPPYFSEDAVRPYIGWPKDKPRFGELPRLAFSHTIPHRLMDWRALRRVGGFPNYVLAIRHPMAILASHYTKWAHELDVDWLTYLQGDPEGRRYRCDIFWIARFWNRWGTLSKRDPSRFLIVKYEETLDDAGSALRAISEHWRLNLSDGAIEEALLAGTKEAMADKIDPSAERNVLQHRKERLVDQFSSDARRLYDAMASELFQQDLGYDLMAIPAKTGEAA